MPTTPTFPMSVGGRLRRADAGRGRPVHDGAGRLVGFATVATRADLTDAMAAGLAEVLATAELPAGAANLLTADVTELAAELLHAGVDGVDLDGAPAELAREAADAGFGCCRRHRSTRAWPACWPGARSRPCGSPWAAEARVLG
jgi:hypothetical protein